ncbi:MAG: NAD(P)/FAD-dependent oxidoreductase [Thermosynechococcaceae cyanobacterium]
MRANDATQDHGIQSNHHHCDVVVMGGGPAGSTLATLLARQGYQVLLLEREKFPRFHVGESLLPASQVIWSKLGITEALQDLNFTYKDAAEFRLGTDPQKSDYESAYIDFTAPQNWPTGGFPEHPDAYQVKRGEFDWFLLKNAKSQGVTVCEQAVVKQVLWEGDRATGVQWRSQTGQAYTTNAHCIADCTGRQTLIGRDRNLIKVDPIIRTSAVFGHFRHVTPNPGREQGAIALYFIKNGWVWFIPIGADEMSVGVVVNRPTGWSKLSPEEILLTTINRYQFLRDRFSDAEQISKIHILRDLSYAAQRKAGDGWLLVGDASFFVDPFLSSGVQAAFKMAEQSADAIDVFLKGGHNQRPLRQYQRWCQGYEFHIVVTMRLFYWMMGCKPAMEIFLNAVNDSMKQGPDSVARCFVAWSLGYFDFYRRPLYLTWVSFFLMGAVGRFKQRVLGAPGWDRADCTQPHINIPKKAQWAADS